METTVKERLVIYIKRMNLSQKRFEEAAGLSNGYVNSLKNSPSAIKLQSILDAFPNLNRTWLLTGEGDMLVEETNIPSVSVNGKPYYDVDFVGGFDLMVNDQTTYPDSRIIVPGFDKAEMWVNVTGHSMEPAISHGDIIAIREVRPDDIQYGEIYAVVLDNFRTIKTIRKAADPDKLRFIPTNEAYDEQEFDRSRVQRVYEVLGSIKRFF